MFWHVYTRARRCPELAKVVLATDDERIQAAAKTLNVPVVMTRRDHPSGTDRVLEAARALNCTKDAVVVNIQGDEPALEPDMLTELLGPFANPDVCATTLARKIDLKEARNPDRVKVVFATDGSALYFSRSPIPHHTAGQNTVYFVHVGIYAFRMAVLEQFVALSQSRLEIEERLEQLRLLENNIPIHIVVTGHQSIAVDRPEDIQTVCRHLNRNRTRDRV
jgi:3-deoxy-manno-octulosonate cytidylyltransferase (CMP-KDO synthetase)